MSPVFDVWDSATNTELVNRAVETVLEQEPLLGATIAPLVPVTDRKVKRGTIEVAAFGKGQFKARNAVPPIFIPRIAYSEEFVELAFLEEMTPLEEDEWHDLTGDNEYLRNRAGVAILARARILQLRNERLTEWMRWRAFEDNLVISLADLQGQDYKLVYGMPADQKPTASPFWSDRANAKPITNLRTWQKLLMSRIGRFGTRIFMSTNTWEDVQYSAEANALLNPYGSGNETVIPKRSQIEGLLYGGDSANRPDRNSEQVTLTITDAGFRDEGATGRGAQDVTLYLPDGYVLMVTNQQVDGENIADMPDGRVAVTTNGGPPLVWKQGTQSETMLDLQKKVHFWRQASARIPRINVPRAFVYAKVWNV